MVGVAFFTTVVAYLFGPLFDQVLTPGQSAAVKQELAADPAARGLGKALGASEAARKTAVIRSMDDGLERLQKAVGVTEQNRAFVLPAHPLRRVRPEERLRLRRRIPLQRRRARVRAGT